MGGYVFLRANVAAPLTFRNLKPVDLGMGGRTGGLNVYQFADNKMRDPCLHLNRAPPRDLKLVQCQMPRCTESFSTTVVKCLIAQERGAVVTTRFKQSSVLRHVRPSLFQLNSTQPKPSRQRLQLLRELGQFVTGGTRLIGIFVIVFGDQSNVADGAVHFDRRGALLTRE